MSGARLKVRWTEPGTTRSVPIVARQGMEFARLGVELEMRRCPSCQAPVYSRRHKWCGVCGEVLPDSCRFTSDEVERVNALLQAERQRHRAWLRKAEAA